MDKQHKLLTIDSAAWHISIATSFSLRNLKIARKKFPKKSSFFNFILSYER